MGYPANKSPKGISKKLSLQRAGLDNGTGYVTATTGSPPPSAGYRIATTDTPVVKLEPYGM